VWFVAVAWIWIDFLATFDSGLLTFLAGAEIDPASFKKHLKPSLISSIAKQRNRAREKAHGA
jgi:hypothetical protein